MLLLGITGGYYVSSYNQAWVALLSLLLLPPFLLPIAVRRLHDIGWSGWFGLMVVTHPILAIISIMVAFSDGYNNKILPSFFVVCMCINMLFALFLLVKKGRKGVNKYGQVPRHQKKKSHLILWIILILSIVIYVIFVDVKAHVMQGGPVDVL